MTDTTMMERIARALCAARGIDSDQCVFGTGWADEDGGGTICHRYAWEDELPAARAALEAMRNPTMIMLVASWSQTQMTSAEKHMMAQLGTQRGAHFAKTQARWRAMIDAILTEDA